MEREFVAKIEGRGVDGDDACILIYRLNDQISLVATAEQNGDTEIMLSKTAIAALGNALKEAFSDQ